MLQGIVYINYGHLTVTIRLPVVDRLQLQFGRPIPAQTIMGHVQSYYFIIYSKFVPNSPKTVNYLLNVKERLTLVLARPQIQRLCTLEYLPTPRVLTRRIICETKKCQNPVGIRLPIQIPVPF